MNQLSGLKSSLEIIKKDHGKLSVDTLIIKNRDYKEFLSEIRETSMENILSTGRKLPLYRLNFLALAILDDDKNLRKRIEKILLGRKHSSYLNLLFPFIQNNIDNLELMRVVRDCFQNDFPSPIIGKKRKIFMEIIESSNPSKAGFDYLMESGEELEFFMEWTGFNLNSNFMEEIIIYFIKECDKKRINSSEILLYLPLLEKISLNYFVDFIKKYSMKVEVYDFKPELAHLAVKKLGEPDSPKNKLWKQIHFYVRDIIREVHVKKLLVELSLLHTKFEFYTLFKNEIYGINYKKKLGLVFILFKNIIVIESTNKNSNGSIFSREVLGSFVKSKDNINDVNDGIDREISPDRKLALEILPVHDIDYDDAEYILKRYVKRRGIMSKIKRLFSRLNWRINR